MQGFSLSDRGKIGQFLRRELALDGESYSVFLQGLIQVLIANGFLRRLEPLDDHEFLQLDAGCLIWMLGVVLL